MNSKQLYQNNPNMVLRRATSHDLHLRIGALRDAAFTRICSVEPNSSQNVIALGRFLYIQEFCSAATRAETHLLAHEESRLQQHVVLAACIERIYFRLDG